MAKRLLIDTDASVTDVAYSVGYNSVGTFTSRFTHSVGVSPGRYRSLAQQGFPRFSSFELANPGQRVSAVTGTVRAPVTMDESSPRVYVAAFSSPVVEGIPQACDVLNSPGPYNLNLPDGIWYVRAAAVATRELDDRPPIRRPVLIGLARPVGIVGGHAVEIDIKMRSLGVLDLPILLALPELDSFRIPKEPRLASVG